MTNYLVDKALTLEKTFYSVLNLMLKIWQLKTKKNDLLKSIQREHGHLYSLLYFFLKSFIMKARQIFTFKVPFSIR